MFDLQEGLAVDHQYDRSPSVPRPGRPLALRVATGPEARRVTVVAAHEPGAVTPDAIERDGVEYPARRVGSHWEAVLPGMPDGTIVNYVVRSLDGTERAWYADGHRPQRAATVFTHRVTSRRPPAWTHNAVVYQIFVDRFATAAGPVPEPEHPRAWAGGDLPGITTRLPYLADLGINTIWLTPIFSCTSYHGYDTKDFGEVDWRFGGNGALHELVTEAAAYGIGVLLDFVPNHVSNEHPWFVDAVAGGATRDWFTIGDDGSYDTFFGNPGMPKVNVNHPEARAALIAAARHWLDEYGIAGYRIDHVLGPSEAFFADLATDLNTTHPDAWLFGEATATPAFCRRYGGVLDGVTDFLFAYALRDFLAGELDPAGLVEVEQEAAAVLAHEDFSWVRFFDNHDMGRGMHRWDNSEARLIAATEAILALPGIPALLYGTEQGLSHEVAALDGGLEVGRVSMRFGASAALHDQIRAAVRVRVAAAEPPETPVVWHTTKRAAAWRWGRFGGRLEIPPS
jgi:hypothetical protein